MLAPWNLIGRLGSVFKLRHFVLMAQYFELPSLLKRFFSKIAVAIYMAIGLFLSATFVLSQSGGIIGTGSQPLAILGTVTQLGSIFVNGTQINGDPVRGLPIGQKVIVQAEATPDGVMAKGVIAVPSKIAEAQRTANGVSIFGRTVVGVLDGPMKRAIEHTLTHVYDGAWVQYQGINVGSDGIIISELKITSLPGGGASTTGVLMRAPGRGVWQLSGVPIQFTRKALPNGYLIPSIWEGKVFNVSGFVENGILMVENYELDKYTSSVLMGIDSPMIIEGGYVKTDSEVAISSDLGDYSFPLASFPGLANAPAVGILTLSGVYSKDRGLALRGYRTWQAGASDQQFLPILTLFTFGAAQSEAQ